MQNLRNYFSELSTRDSWLLAFAVTLLSFVFFKFFIFSSLEKTNDRLNNRATLIQEQSGKLATYRGKNNAIAQSAIPASQLITNYLKKNGIASKLKQIRTTQNGEQRVEIEDIQFEKLLELLETLEKDGAQYSSLQIKERKTPGLVNTILTLPN